VCGPRSVRVLQGNLTDNPFESVDPAPAAKKPTKEQVPEFERQLLDQSLPLFERYKAMFSLRNNRSRAAVLVSALLLLGCVLRGLPADVSSCVVEAVRSTWLPWACCLARPVLALESAGVMHAPRA